MMELIKLLALTCLCLVISTHAAPAKHHKNHRHSKNSHNNNNKNHDDERNGPHARAVFGSWPRHAHSRHSRTRTSGLGDEANDVIHYNNNNARATRKIRQLKRRERKGKFSFQDCGKWKILLRIE